MRLQDISPATWEPQRRERADKVSWPTWRRGAQPHDLVNLPGVRGHGVCANQAEPRLNF